VLGDNEWRTVRELRAAASRGALRIGIHQDAADVEPDYAPVDPYGPHFAKLRAAAATPLSTFEDEYKATRMRDLAATRRALDAEEPPPRMTAAEKAELAAFTPPNAYETGIKALQEKRRR
jgi:hypothetical protein